MAEKNEIQVYEGKEIEDIDADALSKMESVISPVNMADMGLLPVHTLELVLSESKNRSDYFLKWIMDQMIEGVHYGFPPNCRPSSNVSPTQWVAKPSLYQAGALKLIDLFKLRSEFSSDIEAWKMSGEIKGLFFRKCKLIKPDGSIRGEGTGAFEIGEKKMNANSAIKMADKRALVAAVLKSIPVAADLFTQDMENIKAKKASLIEMKDALHVKIEKLMEENNSVFDGNATSFLQVAIAEFQGEAGSRLKTKGAVKAFEEAIDNNEIDWHTGEYLNSNKEM